MPCSECQIHDAAGNAGRACACSLPCTSLLGPRACRRKLQRTTGQWSEGLQEWMRRKNCVSLLRQGSISPGEPTPCRGAELQEFPRQRACNQFINQRSLHPGQSLVSINVKGPQFPRDNHKMPRGRPRPSKMAKRRYRLAILCLTNDMDVEIWESHDSCTTSLNLLVNPSTYT